MISYFSGLQALYLILTYFKSNNQIDSFFPLLLEFKSWKDVEQIPSQTNEKQSSTNCEELYMQELRSYVQMYVNVWLCIRLETVANSI